MSVGQVVVLVLVVGLAIYVGHGVVKNSTLERTKDGFNYSFYYNSEEEK